jgi:3'(2'), 5'-bisphosphate nucleotidase
MDQTPLSAADIEFVNQLVRKSGATAMQMREGVGIHTKSGPHDLVTDADLKISKIVTSALAERFPADLIVSEEDKHVPTESTAKETRRIWLIDPIDGTQHYVDEDGQYSCMVGLVVAGVPVYGWIYQPTVDTLYAGGIKYGAWKTVAGEAPVRYNTPEPLHENGPVRMMAFWGDRRRHPWLAELPDVSIVAAESFGLTIMRVLEGEADLLVNLTGRTKLWDTAPAVAIALGNKMDVGTADGKPLPYPVPNIQHGASVIIGRPGAIAWGLKHINGRAIRSVS